MTEGMERIINELKGENKTTVIERLYSENETAKETQKLRLASDLNNLIFYLNNNRHLKILLLLLLFREGSVEELLEYL